MVGDGASSKQDLEQARNQQTETQALANEQSRVHGGRAAGDRKWMRPFIEHHMFAGNCAKL
jgi:hypothetical protein